MTDQEKRIAKENKRLQALLQLIPSDRRITAEGLIQQASFMKVVLDDLHISIMKNGYCDTYQNGEYQQGQKQSAELQAYNSTIKNYTTLCKHLDALLPKGCDSQQSFLYHSIAELRNELGMDD